jgi:hypothetical protein
VVFVQLQLLIIKKLSWETKNIGKQAVDIHGWLLIRGLTVLSLLNLIDNKICFERYAQELYFRDQNNP